MTRELEVVQRPPTPPTADGAPAVAGVDWDPSMVCTGDLAVPASAPSLGAASSLDWDDTCKETTAGHCTSGLDWAETTSSSSDTVAGDQYLCAHAGQ